MFGSDPFFHICIVVEVVLWIFFGLLASCLFCGLRRMRCSTTSQPDRDAGQPDKNDRFLQQQKQDQHHRRPSDVKVKRCRWTRLTTAVLGYIAGYVSMVVFLAVLIPLLMPYGLYLPDKCDGDWCRNIPGAQNLFVRTKTGNNISLRLFPAHKSGKYFSEGLR